VHECDVLRFGCFPCTQYAHVTHGVQLRFTICARRAESQAVYDSAHAVVRGVLPHPTIKSRLKALRELRGISQKEFSVQCASYGLDKQEGGRVERGDIEFRGKHVPVFSAVLNVPMDWWTDPDLDRLLWAADSGDPARRFADLAHMAGQPPDELPESPQEEEDDEDASGADR
jgi:transcriptional regulator with XRE-family HTH domain